VRLAPPSWPRIPVYPIQIGGPGPPSSTRQRPKLPRTDHSAVRRSKSTITAFCIISSSTHPPVRRSTVGSRAFLVSISGAYIREQCAHWSGWNVCPAIGAQCFGLSDLSDLRTQAIRPCLFMKLWCRYIDCASRNVFNSIWRSWSTEFYTATPQTTSARLLGCPTFQVDHRSASSHHLLIIISSRQFVARL